ncbi:hypothetical protein [Geothermobacter hydrogeniphilus]|uniref:hypothetical protein n=1 Tax=Geothermobacter hydrogeniphilus TaxID=1969733 RepID=UPI001551C414|nr:hypothetical protein [Geothermobacter hydrogeniphilus]
MRGLLAGTVKDHPALFSCPLAFANILRYLNTESSEFIADEQHKSLTRLHFPEITGEPSGAPQIFENRIQLKRLHSSSAMNPLIQAKLSLLSAEPIKH